MGVTTKKKIIIIIKKIKNKKDENHCPILLHSNQLIKFKNYVKIYIYCRVTQKQL